MHSLLSSGTIKSSLDDTTILCLYLAAFTDYFGQDGGFGLEGSEPLDFSGVLYRAELI